MKKSESLPLNDQVLIASYDLSEGNLDKTFTAEEILISVWEKDPFSFGLRGYEKRYPDSNKLYTKLDGKKGLVSKGILIKIGDREYKLSTAGVELASRIQPFSPKKQIKFERELYVRVCDIINHAVFKDWIDNEKITFLDASWFWGIAPGTPPKVVDQRLKEIEQTLDSAKSFIKKQKVDKIIEQHDKVFLTLKDVDKCIEFHSMLKKKFEKELTSFLKN